ncbi:MAG: hypothetical protein AAF739_00215 [Pseudomonadota bacterium]
MSRSTWQGTAATFGAVSMLSGALIIKGLRWVLGLLGVGVTIPLGLILAAGLWVHFDKSSTARAAVDRAVTELVAGAELRALRAKLSAAETIANEERRRAAAAEAANTRFRTRLQDQTRDLETAQAELTDLLAQPINDQCVVDDALLERLRNE